jgi:hypothetical protein
MYNMQFKLIASHLVWTPDGEIGCPCRRAHSHIRLEHVRTLWFSECSDRLFGANVRDTLIVPELAALRNQTRISVHRYPEARGWENNFVANDFGREAAAASYEIDSIMTMEQSRNFSEATQRAPDTNIVCVTERPRN